MEMQTRGINNNALRTLLDAFFKESKKLFVLAFGNTENVD